MSGRIDFVCNKFSFRSTCSCPCSEQLNFVSNCSIIHRCFSLSLSLCVHPKYTGSINRGGSSTSISLAAFSTWVRGSALPNHFDVVHVDRKEQPKLSMHVQTFPCWYVLPFVFETAPPRIFSSKEGLPLGDRAISFQSETTGSSQLFGHGRGGILIHISGQSASGNLNNLGASCTLSSASLRSPAIPGSFANRCHLRS